MTPAVRELRAARNVPFGETLEFTLADEPFDFTGYTGTMQVRLYEGAAGAALVDLANVTTDVQGVRILSGGMVQIRIDEATLAAIAGQNTPEAGDAQTFAYDLVLTDPAAFAQRWVKGAFVLEAGVTD